MANHKALLGTDGNFVASGDDWQFATSPTGSRRAAQPATAGKCRG